MYCQVGGRAECLTLGQTETYCVPHKITPAPNQKIFEQSSIIHLVCVVTTPQNKFFGTVKCY